MPSAPETEEEMSGEEELGEDKGVGLRAELLLRPSPEAPAPPISKEGQVVVKKIKDTATMGSSGRGAASPRLWGTLCSAPKSGRSW